MPSGAGALDFHAQESQVQYVVGLKRAKAVRFFLPLCGRGVLAVPFDQPATLTLERPSLEFKEIHALRSAQQAAAQPQLC